MKYSIFAVLFILCLSASTALAQEPCPTAAPEAPTMADPNEKCKPELGETAPVLFVFPDDKKDDKKDNVQADKTHEDQPVAENPEKKTI